MDIFYLLRNEKDQSKILERIKLEDDLDKTDSDGYNMLMLAMSRNLKNVSLELINLGIDLDHQNYKGLTALHVLAVYFEEDILKSIVSQNVNVNLVDTFGNNALWTAIINDKGFGTRLKMIEKLIDHGVNIDHKNNVGRSPRMLAHMLGYPEIIKLVDI